MTIYGGALTMSATKAPVVAFDFSDLETEAIARRAERIVSISPFLDALGVSGRRGSPDGRQ